MYSLQGFEQAIRNVYLVAHPYLIEDKVSQSSQLREPYLDFLAERFPDVPLNRRASPFVEKDQTVTELAHAFSGSNLDDLQQSSIIGRAYGDADKERKVAFAEAALVDFLALDDALNAVFTLVIHSIFVSQSNVNESGYGSHGGSASGAIGSIWLSMQDSITHDDMLELYIHELTHHLMFIDELVHGHFDYQKILHEENFAYSAILNRIRPLDKVVHSIIVAVEIMLARVTFLPAAKKSTVHPDTSTLLSHTSKAVDSVYDLPNLHELVTPRVEEVLVQAREACMTLQTSTSKAGQA